MILAPITAQAATVGRPIVSRNTALTIANKANGIDRPITSTSGTAPVASSCGWCSHGSQIGASDPSRTPMQPNAKASHEARRHTPPAAAGVPLGHGAGREHDASEQESKADIQHAAERSLGQTHDCHLRRAIPRNHDAVGDSHAGDSRARHDHGQREPQQRGRSLDESRCRARRSQSSGMSFLRKAVATAQTGQNRALP